MGSWEGQSREREGRGVRQGVSPSSRQNQARLAAPKGASQRWARGWGVAAPRSLFIRSRDKTDAVPALLELTVSCKTRPADNLVAYFDTYYQGKKQGGAPVYMEAGSRVGGEERPLGRGS